MNVYSIFGSWLRSDISLPELRAADAIGQGWTLQIADGAPPLLTSEAQLLGTDEVISGVAVRLYRLPRSYVLEYDDTGTFEIAGEGREIRWWQGPRTELDAARLDIINRVLPIALHASGMLCLHGSAVSMNGGGLAFLAPRHHGKSTLALALADRGARILTDDLVVVEPRSPVMARPGIHSVRLLDDAARAVVGDAQSLEAWGAVPLRRRDLKPVGENGVVTKQVLRALPTTKLMFEPVPLAAIYLVVPASDGAEAPAVRTQLPAVRAAISLVEQTKPGVLLGKNEAALLFERAVAVAREVPVYQLTIVRDLARIGEVATHIAQWQQPSNGPHAHGAGARVPA